MSVRELETLERLFYRDRLREARYAALADAEGFGAICFALESLGLRVHGKQEALWPYMGSIARYAQKSLILTEMAVSVPAQFKPFAALYGIVQAARNDAMHTGAYARHATHAAIELCIGLEEALMADVPRTVGNLMVSTPITVESWQTVAHARQLMLMHSFSFLPVRLGDTWCLLSELGLAKHLSGSNNERKIRLSQSIETAHTNGMEVIPIQDSALLTTDMQIEDVLRRSSVQLGPMLWLVVDTGRPEHLAGVLSPFELM